MASSISLYRVAIMDWAEPTRGAERSAVSWSAEGRRAVLSWRLSTTMDAAFCGAALKEALARGGKPAIFNPGQGSLVTGSVFADILATAGIEISMDGRGRFMATVFARRFLTHEAISIEGDADGRAAQDGISLGLEFSQGAFVGRLHRARGDRRKMPVWRGGTAPAKARDMMANAALLIPGPPLALP